MPILISSDLGVEPELAHDGDHNSVAARPKWAGILISLAINFLFRQFSCVILDHNQARGKNYPQPFDYVAETCEPGHRSGQVIYPRELMIKIHFS